MALPVRGNLGFHEIQEDDGLFKHCVKGRITIDKDRLVALVVENPPKRFDKPGQIFRENSEGARN